MPRLFRSAHHDRHFTDAACGGLKPPPAGRFRRTYLHLLHSTAPGVLRSEFLLQRSWHTTCDRGPTLIARAQQRHRVATVGPHQLRALAASHVTALTTAITCSPRPEQLVGYDRARHDWRSFRLDRLSDPERTRACFGPANIRVGYARCSPSVASIYRALAEHEKRQAYPEAVEQANADFAILRRGSSSTRPPGSRLVNEALGPYPSDFRRVLLGPDRRSPAALVEALRSITERPFKVPGAGPEAPLSPSSCTPRTSTARSAPVARPIRMPRTSCSTSSWGPAPNASSAICSTASRS